MSQEIEMCESELDNDEGKHGIYISEHHVVLLATPWPVRPSLAISWLFALGLTRVQEQPVVLGPCNSILFM
jgi:hypothetical protein